MQDAVILANHLYDIKPTSFENIKNAFKGYKEERYDAVKEQYAQTQLAAKLQFGHVSFLFPVNTPPSLVISDVFSSRKGWTKTRLL